jgi:hypothetical protein
MSAITTLFSAARADARIHHLLISHKMVDEAASELAAKDALIEKQKAVIEQADKDWIAVLREIAKLSDKVDMGDWAQADDETLLEQFDPWVVLAASLK